MTNQEIFDLIARFDASSICTMRLVRGDFSLELSKAASATVSAAAPVPAQRIETPPASEASQSITAPLAGVFYAAGEPGAKPFVAVGDCVKKGQTVCVMEAMKTISEIPAPCDCVITEILKENGTLAAFGEPIFRYRPC